MINMVEMNEWGAGYMAVQVICKLLFLFVIKTRGCGLSAVRVIVWKIR